MNIRAHISASSTKKADDQYVAQGTAYLAFEKVTRVDLFDREAGKTFVAATSSEDSRDARGGTVDVTVVPGTSTTYVDDTQQAITALESQPFTIPASLPQPGQKRKASTQSSSESSHGSVQTPSSAAEPALLHQPGQSQETSSSHLRTPIFDRTAKRPRTVNHGLPASMILKPTGTVIERSQSDVAHGSESQLPTTYSLSDITSDRSKSGQQTLHRAHSDPGQGSLSGSSNEMQRSPIPALKHAAVATGHTDTARVPVATPQIIPRTTYSSPARQTAVIMPQGPKVGAGNFSTHVTGRLKMLVNAPQTIGVYKPKNTPRPIRGTERGYWSFSMSVLTVEQRQKCWSFLEEFLKNGGAGWGVWCVWNPHGHEFGDDNQIVITHCWGEIVEHIYLLLFVATQSKIRKLGAQWVDSHGEVVITI